MAIQICTMDRSRLSLGGGGLNSARKLSAVAVVALLIVPMMLMFSGVFLGDDQGEVVDDGAREITYHDSASGDEVTLTYYGTAVAEYNPQYWSNNAIVGDSNSQIITAWSGPEIDYTDKPVSVNILLSWDQTMNVSNNRSIVTFPNGTVSEVSEAADYISINQNRIEIDRYYYYIWINPEAGSVKVDFTGISGLTVEKVFGGWTTTSNGGDIYFPGDEIPVGVTELYVRWVEPDLFFKRIDVGSSSEVIFSATDGNVIPYCPYNEAYDYSKAENPSSDSYSTIYSVNGNISGSLDVGTYRSVEAIDGPTTDTNWSGSISTSDAYLDEGLDEGLVLIDNIRLVGSAASSHGGESSLYANGKTLIIGTGVTCEQSVQINGGWKSGDHGSDGSADMTDVRIFSGTYANILGGSNRGNIIGTTNVTLLGGQVTDTIYGGSLGVANNSSHGSVTNTRVLVVGGEVYSGDDSSKYTFNEDYQTIVGGSRNSGTVQSSEVTVSHLGKAYAVQGGGRSGTGTITNSTDVTISGKAEIYYMVCGSVTDGNSSSRIPVGSSHVIIDHSAKIGSSDLSESGNVYAGGWDTYTNSLHPSTKNTSLTINGGMIYGSVYGGGFRGTIDNTGGNGNAVTIEINGGTIDGSVYGGGKGGIDPIATGDAVGNTTGRAYIIGDISIKISGGTMGSVYGGGEGAAKTTGDSNNEVYGGVNDAASVTGDVRIEISGGTIGSVYGGGKGLASSSEIAHIEGDVDVSVSGGKIVSVYGGGEYSAVDGDTLSIIISNADEVKGSVYGGGKGDNSDDSLGIVKLTGALSVTIQDTTVSGSVYGGGMMGSTTSQSSTISIESNSTVTKSVYGGGQGASEKGDFGSMKITDGLAIRISSGSTVEGYVFGGGMMGSTTSQSSTISIESNSTVTRSVYGGGQGTSTEGDFGSMKITNGLVMRISSGSIVEGNVYGGGMLGSLNSSEISVEVASSTVKGAIFGGGMGVSGDSSIAKVTTRGISITVSDSTVSDQSTQYALFGGGAAAYTETTGVTIQLLGSTVVNGDVYGGGYGTVPGEDEPDEAKPIMSAVDRTIVVNGASINGNLYGGSRVGQDAPLTGDKPVYNIDDGYDGDVSIRILAGVVMQGIFGGGYMGTSYLDAEILIGSTAVEVVGTLPYMQNGGYNLRVNSIYGGGNLNSPGQDPFGEGSELLMGDAIISISGAPVSSVNFNGYTMPGPGEASDVPKISIYGDIFGQGNYSAIGGESEVVISGYDQDCEYFIRSIQRADVLKIEDSSIVINGSADGTSTGLSVMVSINSITDRMVFGGGVKLELRAQTSGIHSYESHVGGFDGELASDQLYTSGYDGSGNEIILREGRLFYILGENDTGLDGDGKKVGIVMGYSLISRQEGDTYYGAFAIGSLDTKEDSGFAIRNTDGSIEVASFIEGSESSPTRTWYISGHVSVGMVLTFGTDGKDNSGNDTQIWTASGGVVLPHLSNESKLAYAAAYVNPTVQNGVYFLTQDDYSRYIGSGSPEDLIGYSDFFSMKVSGSESETNEQKSADIITHKYNNGTLERHFFEEDYGAFGNVGDFYIRVDSTLLSYDYLGYYNGNTLGTVGNVGTITIHLAEVIEYTVGGQSAYLPVNFVDVEITLNVLPKKDTVVDLPITIMTSLSNGRYVGTGYVTLPSKGTKHTYVISEYDETDVEGEKTVQMYADNTYLGYNGWLTPDYASTPLTGSDSNGKTFGVGGVKDTAMRLVYEGDEGSGRIEFTVTASAPGVSKTVYKVTVTLKISEPVDLSLAYIDIKGKTHYLTVKQVGADDEAYYVLGWSDSNDRSVIEIPCGAVLSELEFSYHDGSKIVDGTVASAMDWLIDQIESVTLDDGSEFVYAEKLDGWYVNNSLKYNMGSEMKEPLTLTAKFGIEIRFHGSNVTLSTTSVFIAPGTSLHDNNIGQPGETTYGVIPWDGKADAEYAGYHLAVDEDGQSYWVVSVDESRFDFNLKLYDDLDLYVPWLPNEYEMTVEVISAVDPSDILEFSGIKGDSQAWAYSNGTWTTTVIVSYNSTVGLSAVADPGYRIQSASGSYTIQDGQYGALTISGVPGSALEFAVPNAGADSEGKLNLEVTLFKGVTVYVDFIGETDNSNGLGSDIVSVSAAGRVSLSITGDEFKVFSMVIGTGEATIQFNPANGYWIAVWDSTGKLLTIGQGGRAESYIATITVTEDLSFRLAVYKAVSISSVSEGIHSHSVTRYDVSGNALVSVDESAPLFKGDTITVTPKADWSLPSIQIGTGTGVAASGSMTYTVLGTVDVVLEADQRSTNIVVSIGFSDSNGPITDQARLKNIDGESVSVSFNDGSSVGLKISVDQMHDGKIGVTISVKNEYLNTQVTASLEGFQSASNNLSKDGVVLDFVLIEYMITYVDYSENPIAPGAGSVTSWSVLSGDSVKPHVTDNDDRIAVDSDGKQIWIRWVVTEPERVSVIGPELFDSSRSLTLRAVQPTVLEPSKEIEPVKVYLESGTSTVFDVGEIFDRTLVFSDAGLGISMTYSDGKLTLRDNQYLTGTGSFILESEDGTAVLIVEVYDRTVSIVEEVAP